MQEYRVGKCLDSISRCSQKLLNAYTDATGDRAREVEKISVGTDLNEFYRRLKNIKDHHRAHPELAVNAASNAAQNTQQSTLNAAREKSKEKDREELEVMFSGEETYGRYLDLHMFFDVYVNLKGIPRVDYVAYLDVVDKFECIGRDLKDQKYLDYLRQLLEYMQSFCSRASPLLNLVEIKEEVTREFQSLWEHHRVPGWEISTTQDSLFCVPCNKQFAKDTVFQSHKAGKKHLKALEALKALQSLDGNGESASDFDKECAWTETLLKRLFEIKKDVRDTTRGYAERKLTLTADELGAQAEEEQEPEAVIESDDDMEEKFYNPLKLPIGWDGKPIPFWLWKLHGLGKEYSCEICGNFVYMGRKAFERHFQESRHSYGMRCLGIPNSRAFQDITAIKDALGLWQKVQRNKKVEEFRSEEMEEFEDTSGNVFSKKTYEDLKRQGLL